MKMIITLRNGVQIDVGVKDYTVRGNRLTGELTGIDWTYDDDPAGTSVGWIDMSEVIAVHSDRDDQAIGAGAIGKPDQR